MTMLMTSTVCNQPVGPVRHAPQASSPPAFLLFRHARCSRGPSKMYSTSSCRYTAPKSSSCLALATRLALMKKPPTMSRRSWDSRGSQRVLFTKPTGTRHVLHIRPWTALFVINIMALIGIALLSSNSTGARLSKVQPDETSAWRYNPSPVKGELDGHYKDHLKEDTKYVTCWAADGFTNQVYTYLNLLYFAWYTDRVAIMPPFSPGHLDGSAGMMAFGDVFDIDRLQRLVKLGIVEWRDVKEMEPTRGAASLRQWERMGCWSAYTAGGQESPYEASLPGLFKLDVAFTYLDPGRYRLDGKRRYTDLVKLAHLGYPSERQWALSQNLTQPSSWYKMLTEPDDQLMCFDSLFYTTPDSPDRWSHDWDPVWNSIGQHLRWTPGIEDVAKQYLNRLFDAPEDGPTPPYISVHPRRGDISASCHTGPGTCMPTKDQVATAIQEIQQQLAEGREHEARLRLER
ncbi:hypothetical protein CALVIDRAFT_374971 [Calocera viscosa TUFC12733]|uniref:Uncharacterized protein n=1 Tax=Calocera viscosa (strain TUFC12733) TaxID=1330018 RepID=A0A167GQ49_CALVF|nr:hypothetical protein CALVIDRAFT_374971 [Calocera viscosa TUFC12733]